MKLSGYNHSLWEIMQGRAMPVVMPQATPKPAGGHQRKIREPDEDPWICWVCGEPCLSIRLVDDEPSHPSCIRKFASTKSQEDGRYRGNDPRVFAYLKECESLGDPR